MWPLHSLGQRLQQKRGKLARKRVPVDSRYVDGALRVEYEARKVAELVDERVQVSDVVRDVSQLGVRNLELLLEHLRRRESTSKPRRERVQVTAQGRKTVGWLEGEGGGQGVSAAPLRASCQEAPPNILPQNI